MPVTTVVPEAVTISWIVISERVRVPVLSEQMTEADPRVSTLVSRLTTALWRAMRCTPRARTTDRIAGSPSGTAATARDTPSRRASVTVWAVRSGASASRVATTTTAMTITTAPSILEIRVISLWRGVPSSSTESSIRAMAPISVSAPVATTTARPVPWATEVPRWTMEERSARSASGATASADLTTASASPVSEDSMTRRAAAWTRRASAPTWSPSPRTSRSPTTSSEDGTTRRLPSRRTVLVAAVIADRAATASAALLSWTKPSTALRVMTSRMMSASTGAPWAPSSAQVIAETTMAPRSR